MYRDNQNLALGSHCKSKNIKLCLVYIMNGNHWCRVGWLYPQRGCSQLRRLMYVPLTCLPNSRVAIVLTIHVFALWPLGARLQVNLFSGYIYYYCCYLLPSLVYTNKFNLVNTYILWANTKWLVRRIVLFDVSFSMEHLIWIRFYQSIDHICWNTLWNTIELIGAWQT
jgi:hypothetical protein